MRINRRVAALCAATALTTLSASTAHADLVYNDLDATIDSAWETMNLTYDSVTSTGSSGTTTLRIQIQGRDAGDHPGCNIQGGPHYIGLSADSSNPGAATVSLPADSRFDSCSDSILVTVTAVGLGSSDVTFAIDESNTSNDPHLTFSLVEARFVVNVTEGSGGSGSTCDADPAAPAWAAAILQANGFKPNSGGFKNYVSRVAGAMTEGAVFAGIVKNAHPDYENAVLTYLQGQTGQSLVMGSRPGWLCTPIS